MNLKLVKQIFFIDLIIKFNVIFFDKMIWQSYKLKFKIILMRILKKNLWI